jgi:hypothetical protein
VAHRASPREQGRGASHELNETDGEALRRWRRAIASSRSGRPRVCRARLDRIRVDLAGSPSRRGMAPLCAEQTAGVDVKRAFRSRPWTSQLGKAAVRLVEPAALRGDHSSGSPAFAQSVEQVRDRGGPDLIGQPFDREFGKKATGFRQGDLHLVHLARERRRGSET